MKTIKASLITIVILLSLQNILSAKIKQNKVGDSLILDIKYVGKDAPDTMFLKMHDLIIGDKGIGIPKIIKATRDKRRHFSFNVSVKKPHGYFELLVRPVKISGGHNLQPIISPQLWESGDSLRVSIDPRETAQNYFASATFKGIGSVKYTARYTLQKKLTYLININSGVIFADFKDYTTLDKNEKRKLDILEDFRPDMSELSFNALKADVCYKNRSEGIHYIKENFRKIAPSDKKGIAEYQNLFIETFDKGINFGISKQGLENSAQYLRFLYSKLTIENFIETSQRNLNGIFNTILRKTVDGERERMLVFYFEFERNSEDATEHFIKANQIIKDPVFKNMISDLKMVVPGWKMADYQFTDENGKKVKLSEFKDKVVLLDFWGAGCLGCVTFYKNTLSKIQDKLFGHKEFIVLSVSVDAKPDQWKKGIKSGNFTDDRAIHLYTNGEGYLHPFIVENKIFYIPTVVLLDKGNVVRYFNTENLYEYNGLLTAINDILGPKTKQD